MNIKKINVDLTIKCNAKCSLCPRKFLKHFINRPDQLDLNKFINLDWDSIPNLKLMVLCGGMGEPTLYTKLAELIDFIKKNQSNKDFLSPQVIFTKKPYTAPSSK